MISGTKSCIWPVRGPGRRSVRSGQAPRGIGLRYHRGVVRLGFIAIVLLSACTGEIQSDNLEGLSPQEQVAQTMWVDKALPVLAGKCVMCHDGSMPMIGYIAGADDLMKRDTLINYVPRIVNMGAPQSSRILTKGDHTALGGGPALDAPEASAILAWIVAERDARPAATVIRTAQAAMMVCASGQDPCPVNVVDISALGAAGSVEFAIEAIGSDSYFRDLKIKAGADGLYIEHPLLETWPAGATEPKPDPLDRFFAVQQNIEPNTELLLGGTGTASVTGFAPTDPISLRFDVVEKKRP